jgi:hypothetical protein
VYENEVPRRVFRLRRNDVTKMMKTAQGFSELFSLHAACIG